MKRVLAAIKVETKLPNPTVVCRVAISCFRELFPHTDFGKFVEQNHISYFAYDAWMPVRGNIITATVVFNVTEDDDILLRLRAGNTIIFK